MAALALSWLVGKARLKVGIESSSSSRAGLALCAGNACHHRGGFSPADMDFKSLKEVRYRQQDGKAITFQDSGYFCERDNNPSAVSDSPCNKRVEGLVTGRRYPVGQRGGLSTPSPTGRFRDISVSNAQAADRMRGLYWYEVPTAANMLQLQIQPGKQAHRCQLTLLAGSREAPLTFQFCWQAPGIVEVPRDTVVRNNE